MTTPLAHWLSLVRNQEDIMYPTGRLLERLRNRALSFLRGIPLIDRIEFILYESIEEGLSRAQPEATCSWVPSIVLDRRAIRESYSRRPDYRVVDPECLSTEDRTLLERCGIKVSNLRSDRPADATSDGVSQTRYSPSGYPDVMFQLDALRNGGVEVTGPISGRRVRSDRSFLVEPGHSIFYRYVDEDVVCYLAVGREGMGYVKLYWYLPRTQTVVLLGVKDWAWLGRWELDQFRAFVVANWRNVLRYLKRSDKPTRCAIADQGHFAHHIWNTLTGLQKLVNGGAMDHVDKFLVTCEPMGPVDRIFPEIDANRVDRLTDLDVINQSLSRNYFLIRLGATIVDDELVERVCRVAAERMSVGFLDRAQEFRNTHWPIMWATIRAGNRTWDSQVQGIAAIANKFKREYPRFALVIDGYALPDGARNMGKQQAQLIAEERALAKRVCDLLDPAIDVHVTIGEVIFDSVVYARQIDFYLAHHASLQLKVGWIANKPGVVHSNRSVLSGILGTKCHYPAFMSRSNGIVPIYLEPDVVKDVGGAITTKGNLRWIDPMDNYDFDFLHAYGELAKLVGPARQ